MPVTEDEARWAYYVPQPIPAEAVAQAPESLDALKLLDPAVGSGHFLIVAFDLLFALHKEEDRHRGRARSEREIAELDLGAQPVRHRSRSTRGADRGGRVVVEGEARCR